MTVYADPRHLDHLCCVDSGTASLRWHDPQYHDQVVRFPFSTLTLDLANVRTMYARMRSAQLAHTQFLQ
jgi:hypothetical protein